MVEKKNIDPNNLEETMEHYMEDEVSEVNDGTDATGVMGKHYTVALQGIVCCSICRMKRNGKLQR